jgi:hypothetical protein
MPSLEISSHLSIQHTTCYAPCLKLKIYSTLLPEA